MAIYRLFASTEKKFADAVIAKNDTGPYDSRYSTPTFVTEASHFAEAADALKETYPDSPVFASGGTWYFYFVDEAGARISVPEPECPDDSISHARLHGE